MPNDHIKRMDWYKTFPRDFQSSMKYRLMKPAQRGAYRDLLDACWVNFPDVSYPYDEAMLREVCNIRSDDEWKEVMPPVLRQFELRDGRLYNTKLRSQVDETLIANVNARIRRLAGKSGDIPEIDSSGTPVGLQNNSSGTIQRREEERRKDTDQEGVGDVLASMSLEGQEQKVLQGQPGYYRRGQYPGTSPKAIFAHMAKAWSRARGDAAYLRYPSKFPESWEQLCDQKSADLIVPAFELWIQRHGMRGKIDWPLSEFLRVAEDFMAQVIPLNDSGPAVQPYDEEATTQSYIEAHEKVWTAPAPAAQDGEMSAEDFLATIEEPKSE